MKQKGDENKWLIPNRSNSSPSHAVSRLSRPSEPQQCVRPEDAPSYAGGTPSNAVSRADRPAVSQEYKPPQIQNAQSHAVTRVNRSAGSPQGYEPPQIQNAQSHAVTRVNRSGSPQGYEPPQAVNAQSHAVVRRRGTAPEITPAPKLPSGGANGVPQQSLPAGAVREVSHVPERLGRGAPAISPEVPPVTGGSMVPKRIQENPVPNRPTAESVASGYVPRIQQPAVQPEPYSGGVPASSNVVRRVRPIPPGSISETKLTPPLQKLQMEEMPSVGGGSADDSGNQFADRWSFPEE